MILKYLKLSFFFELLSCERYYVKLNLEKGIATNLIQLRLN